MDVILQPLSGHALFVLLVQLALLLALARTLAEGMRRIGQPAVLGELLAGMVLGPTILGRLAPELSLAIFPPDEAQFHLLEVISWLGMVLLLLLTGLETDIRAIRRLGRAAVFTSLGGMSVLFSSGFLLGSNLPDVYLTDPANRPIFAAFLATAMAITAMPVIAKILIDLNLMRRNVGMVILSAGVIDDTTGWLVLSIIAGVAAGGAFVPLDFALTLLSLAAFLAALRWVAYPLLGRALRYLNERVDLVGADISLILVFTFSAAAVTEFIGVHAVFGAFAAGILVRQLPRVRADSLHALEVFVLAGLSPIFFAFVGLKVNLWALTGWELPAMVIGVAVAGKLVGCYAGARLGGLSHWEGLAAGFGMNARGAMELIVAIIGLSLGLLTPAMYSTIVLLAVVTSFMAPLLLRMVVHRIPLTDEERRRQDAARGLLLPEGAVRILVPTAGGSNALSAFRLAAPLMRTAGGQTTALYVETRAKPSGGFRLRRRPLAGTNLEGHLQMAGRILAQDNGSGPVRSPLLVRQVQAREVAAAVLDEARRDYDLLFLGAATENPLHDALALKVVNRAPLPVVVVRAPGARDGEGGGAIRRILVPVDGSVFSRYAAELGFAVAEASGAEVVLLHVIEPNRLGRGSMVVTDRTDARPVPPGMGEEEEEIFQALEPVARAHGVPFQTRLMSGGSPDATIIAQSVTGEFDLLIMGTENKTLGRPLFSGQGTAEIMARAGCMTAVVVPRMG